MLFAWCKNLISSKYEIYGKNNEIFYELKFVKDIKKGRNIVANTANINHKCASNLPKMLKTKKISSSKFSPIKVSNF